MTDYAIRPLEEGDIEFINDLKPAQWSDLRGIHRFYRDHPFCYPRKIVIKGELAGIGTAICHGTTGWLAHIIVSEAHRNRGLGRCLVNSLVSLLTETLPCRTVSLIATDLGYPVYSRCGFAVQTEYASFTGHALPEEDPSPLLFPLDESWRPSVGELDGRASGEDRRRILAPHAGDGWGFGRKGRLEGFYLPRLGEGLIAALSEEAGLALLRKSLGGKEKITLPADNGAAGDFLAALGYAESARMRRMVRGEPFPWNPGFIYSRIGGYLG